MRRTLFALATVLVGGLMFTGSALAEGEFKLAGGTTLAKEVKAKQADIEAKAGVKLHVTPNGAGRGVAMLSAGQADMAMIAGVLKMVIEDFNKKNPGGIADADYKDFIVAKTVAKIMVNPNNQVDSLTLEQVSGLLSGKITNWKDVGGADAPVVVVLPPQGDGLRTMIQSDVMGNAAFTKECKLVQLAPDVCKLVAQIPGSVAFASAQNTTADVKAVKTDKPIEMSLCFVTKGEPSDIQKKVIEATKAVLMPGN